jgi:hypothetical protein
MSTTTFTPERADADDLAAVFAALRDDTALLRPGFAAALRARLLAEIVQIGQDRWEVTPYGATLDAGPAYADRTARRVAGQQ